VKYLRDKLFSALKKVPHLILQMQRVQKKTRQLLHRKTSVSLAPSRDYSEQWFQSLRRSESFTFILSVITARIFLGSNYILNNPSIIAELQELERWDKKFSVAASANEGFFSRRWIAEHLFSMSHEEFLRNQRELFYDKKFDANLAATAEAEQEMAAGALGGGGLGGEDDLGDLGGEDLGDLGDEGLGDLGGEDLGGEDLGGEEAGGEEDVLLAAPGRREDSPADIRRKDRIRKRAAYKKVRPESDKRKTAGRGKNYKAAAGPEVGTARSISQGKVGYGGLDSLAKGHLEEQQTIYEETFSKEESKLLKTSRDAKRLIEELERSELKKNETKAQ
jgi:hypothetical protein